MYRHADSSFFFFFNDTATTEIYTLSLHDALPIFYFPSSLQGKRSSNLLVRGRLGGESTASSVRAILNSQWPEAAFQKVKDRKSTRLNSSHGYISYAVFCLKKKKK